MTVKPFLKWVGGKQKLTDTIIKRIPKFNNYFEPFLGGGAVFLSVIENANNSCLSNSKFFLSDLNDELINLWDCVINNSNELINSLDKFPKERDEEFYYKIRSQTPINNIERSSRLIYLNKMCFNGLYRVNSKGKFNVPIGSYNKFNNPSENILSVSNNVKELDLEIESCSYEVSFDRAKEGDFIYIDPPYCSSYNQYTSSSFSQEKLSLACKDLDRRGVKFLLSNKATDNIMELYKDFNISIIKAFHSVSAKSSTRKKIEEVLISNF